MTGVEFVLFIIIFVIQIIIIIMINWMITGLININKIIIIIITRYIIDIIVDNYFKGPSCRLYRRNTSNCRVIRIFIEIFVVPGCYFLNR